MSNKQELHRLVDQLPDSDVLAALRYLEFLVSQDAPIDPEMLARIDTARRERSPGIAHEDIMREFGL
jgi:hypothetical protein